MTGDSWIWEDDGGEEYERAAVAAAEIADQQAAGEETVWGAAVAALDGAR